MKTAAGFRKDIYDHNRKRFPYIFDEWKWYSYRKFKATLYMEVAPWLAYLFMKAKVRPNTVTVVYAVMGILGGIFLAIPIKWFILAGIIFFFFRPFLDWSDGLLARATNQTSITGDVLDPYGALTGWVALWAGMGLYVASKSGEVIFFYLTPIIPSIFALNIILFGQSRLYDNHIVEAIRNYIPKKQNNDMMLIGANSDLVTKYPRIAKIMRTIGKIFEHNARTVDLICLVILLELLLPDFFISWILFLAFLVWQIVFFLAQFYRVAHGGWAEKELQEKLAQIHREESTAP